MFVQYSLSEGLPTVKPKRPGSTARISGLDTSDSESEMRDHPNVFTNSHFMYIEMFLGSKPGVALLDYIVVGKLSKDLPIGIQGLCIGHSEMSHKGLVVAKAVLSCSMDRVVPVKILNPGCETVHVKKGAILATFKLCDNTVDLLPLSCNNIHLNRAQANASYENVSYLSNPDFVTFQSNFDVNQDLSESERLKLFQCLYEHKEIFITDENPGLGLTNVVKHHIQLKPDFQPKQQRSYRLSPDKKQVLKHQLHELLSQGIIAPVSETEELPITSPIVLVAK